MRLDSQNQSQFLRIESASRTAGMLISAFIYALSYWTLLLIFVVCKKHIWNVCLAIDHAGEQRVLNIAKVCLDSGHRFHAITIHTVRPSLSHLISSHRIVSLKIHHHWAAHYYQHSNDRSVSIASIASAPFETRNLIPNVPPVFYNNQRDYIKLFEPLPWLSLQKANRHHFLCVHPLKPMVCNSCRSHHQLCVCFTLLTYI